jgi:hypothetical protein
MTNEEMNKKMEFIVEHQAKFAAELEIMREVQATDGKLLRNGLLAVVNVVGNLARTQMSTDDRISLLTEAQARTEESIKRLTERLNIFINVVEKYIGGNGGSESHA